MYAHLWQYQIIPGNEAELLACYSPDGDWARLFRRDPGYLGTALLRDHADSNCFVTVDRWVSKQAHADFLATFHAQYDALDAACAHMTAQEQLIGHFEEIV